MALPCALFSSSSKCYKPEELVKQILKVSELPDPQILVDNIHGYEWSFETKYYTATVNLCTTNARTIGSQEFADSLQAFVHFFDPNEQESFELTKAWLPYLEHIEPTVQILVCHTSRPTDVIDRVKTLEWCISNGFELVELSPEVDEEASDEEDDFAETTGLPRIIQALHAHTWPNLEMKDNPTIQSPYLRQLMKEQHVINQQNAEVEEAKSESQDVQYSCETSSSSKSNTAEKEACDSYTEEENALSKEDSKKDLATKEETLLLDNFDWGPLMGADVQNSGNGGQEDDQELDVEEFEQLFSKLKVMKDKAETLPPEERKKYAEQVAVSFWKAIGGDEDEIAGIGEESD